jgi:prolyl-tRNA editing enzyme YbaK/EbsC (Cys-tRNA(Pro) deacylase)
MVIMTFFDGSTLEFSTFSDKIFLLTAGYEYATIASISFVSKLLHFIYRRDTMSIESAKAYFHKFGMENRIIEFDVSSATVDLASRALGVEPARIAKTLSFKTEKGCMLILCAGDARIDNHLFKEHFCFKAKMLSPEEVETLIGHPVGGVCPFGINAGIPVYLDESMLRFDTVFPAVGSSRSAIELTLDELFKYSKAVGWVDICRLPAEAAAV